MMLVWLEEQELKLALVRSEEDLPPISQETLEDEVKAICETAALFRSEFLLLSRKTAETEEEGLVEYSGIDPLGSVARALNKRLNKNS